MADGIVKTLGPTGTGSDYTDVVTMLSEIPADITSTAGDYVIEVKAGKNFEGFSFPVVTTDSSHQIIFRAFAGDEVNGKGEGAGFESSIGSVSDNFFGGSVTSDNITHVQIVGLKVIALAGAGSAIFQYGDKNKVFKKCYIKSEDARGFESDNGCSCDPVFEDCIIAECGNNGTAFGNIGNDGLIRFYRTTFINNTGVGCDDRSFGNRDGLELKNCFAAFNTIRDFQNKIDQSDVDYLASSDTTANDAATTSFPNRTTTDFVDYANGDYNLSPDSPLMTAGSDGGPIGAILGASDGGGAEPSGEEQPVTLINAVQGEHAPAIPVAQSQQVTPQQAIQAESATSLLVAAIQQIAQQNARQNESAQSSAVTQKQSVASSPAVQNENAVQMQIEQSGAQSVVLNNAVQNEIASALTVELQQNVIATVAQQLEYAELSNVTQVQAVTLATATQAESAAPLNIEQYSGQLVTLIAAEQAESAPALFISTISAVAVNPALQQESASAAAIQQYQQLTQVSAVQLEYAEILRIITSGDKADLSGLRLVPVTDIYSLNPINPVTYTLREL